jgi:D-alanyl-D-alanine carboxypeptidase
MLRTTLASSRVLRACALGLVATSAVILFTSSSAEARHSRHRAVRHHHEAQESYNPQFSSIIVDANSGATLESNSPDGIRHPASLTKVMTLYLLFERLEAGKITMDTEMPISQHAADQDPTKLNLRPGQTLRVEDAIKGIVTKSANDAAVVIAEALGGDEDDFSRMMTRKARALGMTRTTYVNASGLPADEQVTTARDQATLARAIQDRFPRYYHYFATEEFNFHGRIVHGHNHLLGSVEGVDGIKTGYIRASGFNLITNLRRGNRHLVGVVMGGRSGGSRDAIMRGLLADNLDKAATTRTVAAITERNPADANVDVAEDRAQSRRAQAVQVASASDQPTVLTPVHPSSTLQRSSSIFAAAAAALPQAKPEPAPLTSGVIQTQPIAAIPGSSEPMKPVKVKTVQIKAAPIRIASAASSQTNASITSAISPSRAELPETSGAVVAKAEANKAEMPPQPANFGTGNGVLGVLPASSVPAASPTLRSMASAEPAASAPSQNAAIKPVAVHTGWIIQVGALDSESEARERIEAARGQAHGLLSRADPFTEPVVAKGDRKLYRARFAGLDRDQAEAACRTLKRSEISCITIRN